MHSSPKIQNAHSSSSLLPSQFQFLLSQDLGSASLQKLLCQYPHQGLKALQDLHRIKSNLKNQLPKEN